MFQAMMSFAGDDAVQIPAEQGEAELRKDCPELLFPEEKVLFAFKDRGGKGRDDKVFTTQRIVVRDVRGMTGTKIAYMSIPYYSIKAFSITSAGGALDNDCSLHLWGTSGNMQFDFVKGTDIIAIGKLFNEMCLTEHTSGASVPAGAPATMPVQAPPTDQGTISKFLDSLGGDARQIDSALAEEQFKREPKILMDDEKVEMAFKCSRDSFLLTTKRILWIDVQGWTGKRVEYKSILWSTVRAFSIESAGSIDRDVDMMIFTDIKDMPRIEQDFRKGCVDVHAVQMFFADKLLGVDTAPASEHAATMAGHVDTGTGSAFAWFGDDSRMIDATQVNQQYHSSPPILQGSEHVEMAFKGRRDLTLFTTKRLLLVDMKGWSGKKVKYVSIPWTTVQAYGVRSAGSFMDKDSEMMIWTDINDIMPGDPPDPRMSFIEIDFQKDKVDLMTIQRYLTARCLRVAGGGYLPAEVSVSPEVLAVSPPNGVENFLAWLGQDARTIDHTELDQQLHSGNPMLQVDEHIVMAFKVGRDTTILTTKRVLVIDVQGWTGNKVEYKSIPYTSIQAFAVESAGSWDRDAQMNLWVKTYWGAIFSQDLRKGKADIIAIQSFLASQIIGHDDGATTDVAHGAAEGTPGGVTGFLQWLGDDAHQIDPGTVSEKLHKEIPILQSDETVDLCFKIGRDMCVFTTKRLLIVDVQGFSGKKVSYASYPIKHICAFSVQSAGSISVLNSAKVSVYMDLPGQYKVSQDLSKSETNIWGVHTMLSNKMFKPSSSKGAGKGGYTQYSGEAPMPSNAVA